MHVLRKWTITHDTAGRPPAYTVRTKTCACTACTWSGFTKREESEYDPFGAGHSSTSISAGLGMAVGRDVRGRKNHVISVIGDGAITGGMAYEAMNHAGFLDKNMIVVLNDNQQVCVVGGGMLGRSTSCPTIRGVGVRLSLGHAIAPLGHCHAGQQAGRSCKFTRVRWAYRLICTGKQE